MFDGQVRRNSTCLPSMEGRHGCDRLKLGERIEVQRALGGWEPSWVTRRTKQSIVRDALRCEGNSLNWWIGSEHISLFICLSANTGPKQEPEAGCHVTRASAASARQDCLSLVSSDNVARRASL